MINTRLKKKGVSISDFKIGDLVFLTKGEDPSKEKDLEFGLAQ
jgi:hypothetical protein